MIPGIANAAAKVAGSPKRVIFPAKPRVWPGTCIPKSLTSSGSLAGHKLAEPMEAATLLGAYIINGLHGHASPSTVPSSAHLVATAAVTVCPQVARPLTTPFKVLPDTLLPHLCIGMDSLENMKAKPTVANLSASGAGQPIFMQSITNQLYQMLFGGISEGEIRKQHEARSSMLYNLEQMAAAKGQTLPAADKQRYGQYVQGFSDMNGLRELASVSGHLRKFAPKSTTVTPTPNLRPTGTTACSTSASPPSSGIASVLTVGSGRGKSSRA